MMNVVAMTQSRVNGLGVSLVSVEVPVFNGWSKEALQNNARYFWAEAINYDLAAKLVADNRFRDYAYGFDPDLKVERFEVHSMFVAPNPAKTILFVELHIYLVGNPQPQFVLWSGNTSAVGVLFKDENGKRYALLTEQARPAIGRSRSCQFPAGIIEPDGRLTLRVSDAYNTAVREMKEETGIDLSRYQPKYVETLYLSQGRISETTTLYIVEIEMTAEQIDLFDEKLTGMRDEHEEITLRVVDFEDLDVITAGIPTSIAIKAILCGKWRRQRRGGRQRRRDLTTL